MLSAMRGKYPRKRNPYFNFWCFKKLTHSAELTELQTAELLLAAARIIKHP